MSDQLVPRHLQDLPAAAKLCYVALADAGKPLESDEIASRVALPERTVRSAISSLREADVADTIAVTSNGRRQRHRLTYTDEPRQDTPSRQDSEP